MRTRRVWDRDSQHIQASVDSVYYTYTMGDARPENIDSMVNNLATFVRTNEGQVAYLFHVVAGAKPPSNEDRARTTAMFNRHAAKLSGVAIVIEASGFAGALLRSAVTMVFGMTRRGFETRTFEDVISAGHWLAQRQGVPASEIIAMAAEARAALSDNRSPRW